MGLLLILSACSSLPISGGSGNATPTPALTGIIKAPATTTVNNSEQLNLSFVYASVNITIRSAEEAVSFPDDKSSDGYATVVRLNLQENNTTATNPNYGEAATLLLVLPGGNTVNASNEQSIVSPGAGINRTNWIDFALSSKVPVSQLVLRLGSTSQNQMNIPLQAGANLSQYQDQTVNPNSAFQYAGLHWTLKTATLSYSYASQQATAGNRYAIVTLSAVNQTSDGFENSPGNYMRLQANGNSVQPDITATFPLSVAADANGSGVVAFLVPQDAHSFTLVMLAQAGSPAIAQTTQDFQVQ